MAVAVANSLDKLGHEFLDHSITKAQVCTHSRSIRKGFSTATFTNRKGLHVFLEIEIEEFENQVELVAIGMNDVEKAHNIGVIHLLEKGNLADCGTGNTLIFGIQADLLQGDDTVGMVELTGLVDNTVGS